MLAIGHSRLRYLKATIVYTIRFQHKLEFTLASLYYDWSVIAKVVYFITSYVTVTNWPFHCWNRARVQISLHALIQHLFNSVVALMAAP